MGKIISPAGEVSFKMKGVKRQDTQLVIQGQMGVWEAEIYLSLGELLRMLLNRNVPIMILTLPIAFASSLFGKRKGARA